MLPHLREEAVVKFYILVLNVEPPHRLHSFAVDLGKRLRQFVPQYHLDEPPLDFQQDQGVLKAFILLREFLGLGEQLRGRAVEALALQKSNVLEPFTQDHAGSFAALIATHGLEDHLKEIMFLRSQLLGRHDLFQSFIIGACLAGYSLKQPQIAIFVTHHMAFGLHGEVAPLGLIKGVDEGF